MSKWRYPSHSEHSRWGAYIERNFFFDCDIPKKSPLFNYLKLLWGSKWNFYEFKKPAIAFDFSSDNEWELETFSYEVEDWPDFMTDFVYPTFSITLNFVRNSGYHNITLILPIIFICIIANLGLILPGIFRILSFLKGNF